MAGTACVPWDLLDGHHSRCLRSGSRDRALGIQGILNPLRRVSVALTLLVVVIVFMSSGSDVASSGQANVDPYASELAGDVLSDEEVCANECLGSYGIRIDRSNASFELRGNILALQNAYLDRECRAKIAVGVAEKSGSSSWASAVPTGPRSRRCPRSPRARSPAPPRPRTPRSTRTSAPPSASRPTSGPAVRRPCPRRRHATAL